MIRKALIPIAGLGTRLLPVTSVVPKGLFPLVDGTGRLRAVVHWILCEARAGGINQAALVVSPGQRELLERYFEAARKAPGADLPDQIEYILQPRSEGFGEAVLRGSEFIGGDEPAFMLLLGDHVHVRAPGCPACAAQVGLAFSTWGGTAMVGMQTVGPADLHLVGAAGGECVADAIYRCRDFIEKPDLDAARKRLLTPGLSADEFLAHCGIYIFTPEIFDCLAELARGERRPGQEIQLADAQSMLLGRHPRDYYLVRIAGRSMDTGTPAGYAAAQAAMAGMR